MKYIMSVLLGAILTFFVQDYIQVRSRNHYNSIWISSMREDISKLHNDVWDLDDPQSMISRIHKLEKMFDKNE